MTATCIKCSDENWGYKKNSSGGKSRYCKTCNNATNKAGKWKHWLKKKYNLTVQAYEAMIRIQDNRCTICESVLIEPHVDHDHATGAVRSLLCRPCNIGLGHFKDSPEALRAAADYIEEHNDTARTASDRQPRA